MSDEECPDCGEAHPITRAFDLNRVEDARKFLRDFRMPNGSSITYVDLADGRRIQVDTATDREAIQIALQLYTNVYEPGLDKGFYCEETKFH